MFRQFFRQQTKKKVELKYIKMLLEQNKQYKQNKVCNYYKESFKLS